MSPDAGTGLILIQSLTQDLDHLFPDGEVFVLLCSVDYHVQVLGLGKEHVSEILVDNLKGALPRLGALILYSELEYLFDFVVLEQGFRIYLDKILYDLDCLQSDRRLLREALQLENIKQGVKNTLPRKNLSQAFSCEIWMHLRLRELFLALGVLVVGGHGLKLLQDLGVFVVDIEHLQVDEVFDRCEVLINALIGVIKVFHDQELIFQRLISAAQAFEFVSRFRS